MIKIYLVLLIGIISVSLSSILIKLTYDVPAIIISSYRLIIASLILVSYAKFKKIGVKTKTGRDLMIATVSGLFLSIHFITWIASIKYTSIASSVTLVSTSPVFVIIISFLLFREKPTAITLIATVVAILGTALIAYTDKNIAPNSQYPNPLFGDFLAILGAFAVSIYFISGSHLRKYMQTFQYITLVYSSAAIFTTAFALLSSKPFFGYRTVSYVYMVLMAVIPQLFGHTSFNWALKHLKASAVAISTLGEPIGATILAYIFFHQTVSQLKLLGMVMVIFSIAVAIKSSRHTN